MKRTFAFLLSFLMVAQLAFTGLPTALAAETVLASFEDAFDYDVFGSIYDEASAAANGSTTPTITSLPEPWVKESSGNEPKVVDGVLKLACGDKNEGAVLYWDNLPGFDFDASKTYTLTFDVKATDFGTKTGTTTRELYFAPDGHYNMIEFRSDKGIRIGSVSGGSTENWVAASAYTLGTTYTCTVVWTPATKTMTATVKNGSTVVGSGSRVIDDFATFNYRTDCFVWRCEDGSSEVSNVTFSDGTTTYTQFESGLSPLPAGWVKENFPTYAPNEPKVKNGIVKFVAKDGLRMKWTELPGFSFDASKTYTITFDTKITNFGTNPNDDYRRELYFAPDGWFNMLELKHDALRAGDTYNYNTSTDYKLNTTYSCTVVWEPASNKMTCTLKNGDTTVVTGSRTKTEFGTLSSRTNNFVWRCEDGAMEVSNMKFTDGTTTYTQFAGVSEEPAFPVSDFVWENEVNVSTDVDFGNYKGNKPKIEGGVAKLVKGDSLRFNWTGLEGFKFDASKTYTMKFDVKVNQFGETMSTNMNREFFFAPGGWYNLYEFRGTQQSGGGLDLGMRAGGDSGSGIWSTQSDYKTGTTYTCEVVWQPSAKKMTATVKNGSTVVVTGSRTKDDFATLNRYTRSFVLRCENGSTEIDNFSFTDGSKTYTQLFNTAMTGGGYWSKEEKIYSTEVAAPQCNTPGVLTMGDNTGVLFNWMNVPNATPYSSTKTYTFDFDLKVTNEGDGSKAASGRTRAFYMGFGGWYNLLEVRDGETSDNNVSISISSANVKDTWSDKYKDIHVNLVWQGSTATTTLTDKNGNVLLTGSRTSTSFTDMSDDYMKTLGLRCEDGQVEIDNFKFKVTDKALVDSMEVNIPSGKQAYYECNIICGKTDGTRITLSDNTVFSFNNGVLALAGKTLGGTFTAGMYNVKMWINPVQNMVTVEATAQDGETASRAIYTLSDSFTNGDEIRIFSDATAPIVSDKLEYLTVNANPYTVLANEPAYSGYETKVHNLVTAFDKDAATDRSFAWTAMANYIGSSDMAVKYRPKGTSTWLEMTAVKVQGDHVADEEYFKADIYNLLPGTEYEYKAGKKGSTDEANDWSKTYTFKTALETVGDFTFLAVGDTQGEGWTGRGFQYARAALDEAFEEHSDAAFILHAGDIVETGTNIGMWNTYFKALGDYGTKYPHFATMGNHITYGGDNSGIDNWNNHFNHPNNGGNAAIDTSKTSGLTSSALKYIANGHAEETIYSFNYGDAHFIVLNTGAYGAEDNILLEGQREWLKKDLEANKDAKWTIMLHHETVYHRNGGGEDHRQLANLVESSGVDLVLQGHSHLVTRTYPMMNQQIVTKEYSDVIPKGTGTIYMTIGSTTTNHDGVGDSSNVEEMYKIAIPMSQSSTTRSMPAYTAVDVTEDELTLTIKQADGLILDKFTIKAECQHVPGAWHTVIQPTTTAPGLQELNCTLCGDLLDSLEIPKLVEIPKTGDETNLALLLVALLASGTAVVKLTGKKRKA